MKNKKGFTLVELLAVIVILALIMGIAVVGIGNVLQTSRDKVYRTTALSIISGVKKHLYLAESIKEGTYFFDETLFDSGGTKSPYGAEISHGNPSTDGGVSVDGAPDLYWKSGTIPCRVNGKSFVKVVAAGDGNYDYSICLVAGANEKFISATEDELNSGDSNTVVDYVVPANPNAPTITGGTTKVYNVSATTLTCNTATTYGPGTEVFYEFGYATSAANFTAGTITWVGTVSTTNTYSVSKSYGRSARYYTCRVYATTGVDTTEAIKTSTTTNMSLVNAAINFDATTNGGTISGTTPLYVSYKATGIYTGRTNTTAATIPTATKSGATFNGWYTAATGGNKVIAADGTVQASVSGWTNPSKQWLVSKTSTTTVKLYAQFS